MNTVDPNACPACHGTGQETVMRPVRPYEPIELPEPCATCAGTGKNRNQSPSFRGRQEQDVPGAACDSNACLNAS